MDISNERIERIKWKLINEGASSLSDSEIERVMLTSCSPKKLTEIAKYLRDNNLLTYDEDFKNHAG